VNWKEHRVSTPYGNSLIVNWSLSGEEPEAGGGFRADQPRRRFARLRRRLSRPCLKALLDQASGLDKENPGTAVGKRIKFFDDR